MRKFVLGLKRPLQITLSIRPSDMTVTSLSDYRIFLEVGIRQNYLLFNVQSVGDDSVRSLAQSSKHPYKEIMLHQK